MSAPISAECRAIPGELAIKPTTNENPLEPSASVMAALAGIGPAMLQRNPDPLATGLRAAIARHHGRQLDQVIAANGRDEMLLLIVTTFADPGKAIGVLNPVIVSTTPGGDSELPACQGQSRARLAAFGATTGQCRRRPAC